jgi:hypothetical protein
MRSRNIVSIAVFAIAGACFSSCTVLRETSKYNFNDGIYHNALIGGSEVYVLRVDEDTIAVFPVQEYKDSTYVAVRKRVNYTSVQKKFGDNKATHTFYRQSFDADVITMPLKYRPATGSMPNQLVSSFNGAFFIGYRVDEYTLHYRRTPLNVYKQQIRHTGYNVGLYAGLGNTLINPWVLTDTAVYPEYEGAVFITGIAANIALNKLTFGVAVGTDLLLDKHHKYWYYQGKPNISLSLGLDLY